MEAYISGQRAPWNRGKLFGQKPPLKPREIWAIRVRLPRPRRGVRCGGWAKVPQVGCHRPVNGQYSAAAEGVGAREIVRRLLAELPGDER